MADDQHRRHQDGQKHSDSAVGHEPQWARQDRHNREADCLAGASRGCQQQPADPKRGTVAGTRP